MNEKKRIRELFDEFQTNDGYVHLVQILEEVNKINPKQH